MPAVTRGELARLALSSPAPGGSITTTLASDETTSSDSDSSESDDDDEDDEDSEEDDSEEEDEDVRPDLSALLLKAKLAARQHLQSRKQLDQGAAKRTADDDLAGNEEMVRFGSDEESDSEEDSADSGNDDEGAATPKGSSSSATTATTARPLPPSLAAPLSRSAPFASSSSSRSRTGQAPQNGISLAQDLGRTVLADQGAVTVSSLHPGNGNGNGKGKEKETGMSTAEGQVGDKWGMAPLPRLSKKQIRAKQPHTAGAQWFNLPATPMTPEIKREIDALRLSNQLDPKKFLRGGAKKDKVGEFFQIGHIIAPSTRATTLSSQPTVQKRSFVEDLLEDEESKAYAKKKTKEVMRKTMSGRKRQRKGNKGAYAMGEGGNKRGGIAGGGKKRKV
ncbi:Fcf2-domain-containing protein [Rhodotorula sp. JG-1b]|nr:Fcf2-domain-containing protein [Rhodotorula sp. JG-1b]